MAEKGMTKKSLFDSCTFEQALAHLRSGRALVFPTDTVFGLGVAVAFASGPDEIYRLKRRDAGKPVAWLVSSAGALETYGLDVPAYAYELAAEGWPGALTLIVRASEAVPPAFRSQQGSIGLRMPDSPLVLALIEELGCPLATSSANLSGDASASSLGNLSARLVQDAGALFLGGGVGGNEGSDFAENCGFDEVAGCKASLGCSEGLGVDLGTCVATPAPSLPSESIERRPSRVIDCTGCNPRVLRA